MAVWMVSGQCLDNESGQFLDNIKMAVWMVSGQCLDADLLLSGECLDGAQKLPG